MVVSPVRLTLIGKPDCHLCEDARAVVDSVVADCGVPVVVDELSILDDAELHAKYWDEIPVIVIDGRVHGIWRFEADRLRAAILAAV